MKLNTKSNRSTNRTRSMSDPAILRNRVTFQPPKLEAGSQNESHTDVSPDTLLTREVIPLFSSTKLEAGSQNENSQTSDASLRYFQANGSPSPISGSSHALQLHPSEFQERRLNSSMPKRANQQSPEASVSHRKNRSHADNEAGSAEEGVREYVIALPRTKKLVVPQIKDIPKKIKLKNSKNWDHEMWEPGMDAGSQTEDKESARSPKGEASSISGPEHITTPAYKRSPAKNLSKQQQQFEELFTTTPMTVYANDPVIQERPFKKTNKDLKTTLPREFSPRLNKKDAKRTSIGHKTPSLPKGIEKKLSFETLPNMEAGSERDLSETHSRSISKLRYGKDFGTTAASIGNDSAPFELKFEAEIAYFTQNTFEFNEVLISSDTDGSKAISEGSSTAEGAASAAEGYFDVYHYLQNHAKSM